MHACVHDPLQRFMISRTHKLCSAGVENRTGGFVLEVHPSWAPVAVNRFQELVLLPLTLSTRLRVTLFPLIAHTCWVQCTDTQIIFLMHAQVRTNYFKDMRFYTTKNTIISHFGLAADADKTAAWTTKPLKDEPLTAKVLCFPFFFSLLLFHTHMHAHTQKPLTTQVLSGSLSPQCTHAYMRTYTRTYAHT